jgi:hypothetical protein
VAGVERRLAATDAVDAEHLMACCTEHRLRVVDLSAQENVAEARGEEGDGAHVRHVNDAWRAETECRAGGARTVAHHPRRRAHEHSMTSSKGLSSMPPYDGRATEERRSALRSTTLQNSHQERVGAETLFTPRDHPDLQA